MNVSVPNAGAVVSVRGRVVDVRVSESGAGRWTIEAALDEAMPVPALRSALYSRFGSRGEAEFAGNGLSAMRFGFGGHIEMLGDT